MTHAAVLEQASFRVREPVTPQASPLWIGDLNTATDVPDEDGSTAFFVIRFLIKNTGAAGATITPKIQWKTTISGTWADLPMSFTPGEPYAPATSTYSHNATTTQILGSGTFVTGRRGEGANTTSSITINGGEETEVDFLVKCDGEIAGGTQFDFRLIDDTTAFDTYTNIAIVTVEDLEVTNYAARGRNDDGNLSAATWLAAENTDFDIDVDTDFRLRFSVFISQSASAFGFRLVFRVNGGSWTYLTGASIGAKRTTTTHYSNDDAIAGNLLSAPSGKVWHDGSAQSGAGESPITQLDPKYLTHYSEYEFCLYLDGADLSNNDTVEFKLAPRDAGPATQSGWTVDTNTVTVTALASGNNLTAAQGSYSLTGNAANLSHPVTMQAAQGAYALSGQTATFAKGYTLTADQGSYGLTGQATELLHDATVQAAQGSYALAGQAAILTYTPAGGAFTLVAQQGGYSLSGQVTGLAAGRQISAAQGFYALSGQVTNFSLGYTLQAGQGGLVLTGQAANLGADRGLTAVQGAYALSGQAATLTYTPIAGAYLIDGAQGAYVLTGNPAILIPTHYAVTAAPGTNVLTGFSVEFTYSGDPTATTVAVINGQNNWLLEMTGYDPGLAAVSTLYFASKGFITEPSDSPANQHFMPRIQEPGSYKQHLFSTGTTQGASSVGSGIITLSNPDGGLDIYRDWGFDGRQLRVLRLQSDDYADAQEWFTGTVEQIEFTRSKVRVRLRDRLAELDKAIQPAKFDGSNVGATGIEGTADDIEGKPKPQTWGKARNISPAPVNTSHPLFGCNFDESGNTLPVASIDAVYDNGVLLTFGADRADLAALQAASPAGGTYDTCLAEALIKPGTVPASLTCDVTEGTSAADRTAAQIVKRILEGPGGLTTADYETVTFARLDVLNSAECGIYLTDETTILEVTTALLDSIGGWLLPSRDGLFRVGRFEAPSGPAVRSLSEVEILSAERQATGDEGRGVPAYLVALNYQRNWTVRNADEVDRNISDARKAWLQQETRTVTSEDASVLVTHLLAPELSIETRLDVTADAEIEAVRRLNLYKVLRDRYRVTVPAKYAAGLRLGHDVELTLDRFGLQDGKLFKLIGIEETASRDKAVLECWG